MVLLKNDGIFTLSSDTKKLNVFGWDSQRLFGGTGSDLLILHSNRYPAVPKMPDMTNESLTKMYTDYRADRPTIATAQQD